MVLDSVSVSVATRVRVSVADDGSALSDSVDVLPLRDAVASPLLDILAVPVRVNVRVDESVSESVCESVPAL